MRPSEVAREELEQAASSGQNELFQKLLDVAGDMHRLKANSRPGGCDQRRDQGMRDMPTKGARGGSAECLCNTARSRWQRSRSGFM
jgi:hypothetical protein